MYRELLDRLNHELREAGNLPAKRGEGVISRPSASPTNEDDPLALMKDWMSIIKDSGKRFREEIKPSKIKQIQKDGEKGQAVGSENPDSVIAEANRKREQTENGGPITAVIDHFPHLDGGGDFSIPTYSGGESEYTSLARQAAQKYGLPEDLFLGLVKQESGFNPNAKSSAGAIGLAQLMPGTAKELGVDPFDPVQNLDGGARYLKQQYDTFGSWDKALAGYNAGPGAVQKYGGIPPYAETQNYVRKILGG